MPCPICKSISPLDILFTTKKGKIFYSCSECKENVFNLAICGDVETEKKSKAYIKKYLCEMEDKTLYSYLISFINLSVEK